MLNAFRFAFALLLGISLSTAVMATEEDNQSYYTISDARVVPVALDAELWEVPFLLADAGKHEGPGDVVITMDDLIAFGKAVWPLIEANRPVYDEQMSTSISVLPPSDNGAAFGKMSGWSAPKASVYDVIFTNLLGMEVIKFRYLLKYQYGGSLDGKGQYLTDVNIVPTSINVLWGFTFNARAKLVAISNRGTAEAPMAGVTLELTYETKNIFKFFRSSHTFHITGNGEFVHLH